MSQAEHRPELPGGPPDETGRSARAPGGASRRDAEVRFIEAWGRMGSVWGISRTMAEVHALLYVTGEPLCTDDIMERLEISRGNASMSMRALLGWGVVSRTHKRGDRKEYYTAEQDVWAIFRAIVRERLKREVDPLLANLHEIRDDLGPQIDAADPLRSRLAAMLEFLELVSGLGQQFTGPSGMGLQAAASMLSELDLSDLRGSGDAVER